MDRHPHSEWEEQLPLPGLLSGYLNLELTLKDRLKCGTTFVFCFCRRHYKSKDSTKHMGLQVAQYMVRRWMQPSNVLRKYQKKFKKEGVGELGIGSQGKASEMRHTDSSQKSEWDKSFGQKGTFEEKSEVVCIDSLQVLLKCSREGERKHHKQEVNLMGLVSLWMRMHTNEFEDYFENRWFSVLFLPVGYLCQQKNQSSLMIDREMDERNNVK